MQPAPALDVHSLSLSDTLNWANFPAMDPRTAQALIRFGLGRRGEEPLPADPAAWLNDQLRQPDPARIDPPPTTAAGLEALRFDRETKPPPGATPRPRAVPGGGPRRAGQRADHHRAVPRAPGVVLDQPLHRLGARRHGRGDRRLRGGGDPPERHRPVRDHAAGGDAPPRHADLPEQRPVGRTGQLRRRAQPSRPEREPRPRMHGAAHGQPRRRLHPGRRDQLRQGADRLVDRPALRPARLPLPPVRPRARQRRS